MRKHPLSSRTPDEAPSPIAFRPIGDIAASDWLELMNDPRVRRHLPLARAVFEESDWRAFVATKEAMWEDSGYGPWAFFRGENFVGWGGLQPEAGEPDLALILHPDHWGLGRSLAREIIRRAFCDFDFPAIFALLPPTRRRTSALRKLGFRCKGDIILLGGILIASALRETLILHSLFTFEAPPPP
jgi:hypothetical protein